MRLRPTILVILLGAIACQATISRAETIVSSPISTDVTWTVTGSPYVVTGDVTVAGGVVLAIEPGVTVQFALNKRILVYGSLRACGTFGSPIVFTNHPPDVYGGAIRFVGSDFSLSVTGVLEHCVFTAASSSSSTALAASYSVMRVVECDFKSVPKLAMEFADCRVEVLENDVRVTGIDYDLVDMTRCAGLIASNHICYTNGGWNALDINYTWAGPGDPTIVIEGNLIESGPGWDADCIDLGTSEAIVRGNVLTHAADKGLSIGERGHARVYDNLIYDCGMGIAVKDESIAYIVNNTIVDCASGIECYRKSTSYPSGGHAFMTNAIIWNCTNSITVDAVSTLEVGQSCIQGTNVWPGAGNTNAAPQFVDAAQHDWRLLPTSPCRDTGSRAGWLPTDADLDGNPRVAGDGTDMGAYEFVGVVDHFAWEPVLSPRYAALPFGVAVSARDIFNNVVTGFSGRARLSGWDQSGQNVIPTSPSRSGQFLGGVWTGQVTVAQPATGMSLRAALTPGPAKGDSARFDVVGNIPALGVSVPTLVSEGDGVLPNQGSVSISETGLVDVIVTLASSDTTEVLLASTVTISAGETNAFFDLTVVDDDELDGTQTAQITASAAGYVSAAAAISVRDNETATLSVSVPASAREGDGVLLNAGRVTVSAPVPTNVVVTLASSDVTEAVAPPTVTVLTGQTGAVFSITIVDDAEIDGAQSVRFTAHVENWTDGTNTMTILDNENTNLVLTLPAGGTEGDGILTNAGKVSISGTLTNKLVVSLLSDDTSEIEVPPSVDIQAGQTSGVFNVTIVDDSEQDGRQTATVFAQAAGFAGAAATVAVADDEVNRFVFSPISSPRTAGVPFGVMVSAQDIGGATVAVFRGTASLSGTGELGPVSLQPAAITFSNGIWQGNVTVNTLDPGVTLTARVGSDAGGTSNPFSVAAGPLHHFAWDTILSPRLLATPFGVRITAQDANNFTVENAGGPLALSAGNGAGQIGIGAGTGSWTYPMYTYYHDARTQVIYLSEEIGVSGSIRALSLEVTAVPGQTMNNWTVRMKHTPLSSYSSAAWDGSGWTVVYQANLSMTSTGWVTLAFGTPFEYDGTNNLMVDFSFNNSSWSSSGQCRFTTTSQSRSLYFYTDSGFGDPLAWSGTTPSPWKYSGVPNIKLNLGDGGRIAPTNTGSLVGGVWTGVVSLLDFVSNTYLRAQDGLGHSGVSNPFDVCTNGYVIMASAGSHGVVAPSGDVVVPAGQSATFAVAADACYHIEDVRTNGVSAGGPFGMNVTNFTWNSVIADGEFLAVFAENLTGNGVPCPWLAAYGLTNDLTDTDGDGMQEWMEYVAGTCPTSASSVLSITNAHATSTADVGGFVLYWPSVSNRTYALDRTTNLVLTPFLPVATDLPAIPPVNVHTDAATGLSNAAYRIRVMLPAGD